MIYKYFVFMHSSKISNNVSKIHKAYLDSRYFHRPGKKIIMLILTILKYPAYVMLKYVIKIIIENKTFRQWAAIKNKILSEYHSILCIQGNKPTATTHPLDPHLTSPLQEQYYQILH